jgi:hypothetical protein
MKVHLCIHPKNHRSQGIIQKNKRNIREMKDRHSEFSIHLKEGPECKNMDKKEEIKT